jgi:hypothetical protein
MTPEQEEFIFLLMVDGRTIAFILERCRAANPPIDIDYGTLLRMFSDNYRRIVEARRAVQQDFLEHGLGSKLTRAMRLAQHADDIEALSTKSPAWSRAYTTALGQLDTVLDPLQKNRIPPNDPWAIFLEQLKAVMPAAQLQAPTGTTESSESTLTGEWISVDSLTPTGSSESNSDPP